MEDEIDDELMADDALNVVGKLGIVPDEEDDVPEKLDVADGTELSLEKLLPAELTMLVSEVVPTLLDVEHEELLVTALDEMLVTSVAGLN